MRKVIIVDTLKSLIEEEKSILSRAEFGIFIAASSEEVIRIHRHEKADIIIADLDMPGMNGDELCGLIRRDKALKDVSFIIACFHDKEAVKRCEECGVNSFITKPIDPEELSRKIREFLDVSSRKSLRVLMQVTVKGESKNKFFFSTSHNISASGVLLETDKTLAQGDKITCSFFIRSHQITLEGEIVRVVNKSPDVNQYGVKFVNLDQHSRAVIEDFVESRKGK